MAKTNNLTDFLTSLATKLRTKLGISNKINPQDFENKIDDVYNAGKQVEYDAFWNQFQENGNRTSYTRTFTEESGVACWSKGFTPKYPLKVAYGSTQANFMFYHFGESLNSPVDFVDFMQENGITFYCNHPSLPSTDYLAVYNSTFSYSKISHLPKLFVDRTLQYTFENCSHLVTIDELRFYGSSSSNASTSFYGCSELQNITFTGSLQGGGINLFSARKLTHASIMSLINILYDYSASTTTKTVALGPSNLAKLTDEEKAIATAKGWTLT